MVSFRSLLLSAPHFETQLCLLALHSLVWSLWLHFAPKYVQSWVSSKSWKDRLASRNKLALKKGFNINVEHCDALTIACDFICIAVVHAVGGILCLPSALGGTGEIVWALARHGAMCEMGWELQDVFTRAYKVLYGGQRGRAQNPLGLLIFVGIHHAMGLSMIIPMNIYFGKCATYHEFVWLLKFAGAIAILSTNYGYTLDVETKSGLLQMKIVVTITWMVIAWSRVLQYAMVGSNLLEILGTTPFMYCGGCTALALMGVFNLAMFMDATQKLFKFIPMRYQGAGVNDHAIDTHGAAHVKTCSANFRRNSMLVPLKLAKMNDSVSGAAPLDWIQRSVIRRRSLLVSAHNL